ncbi:MAG: pilus assembly protein [Methyloceanibacter sp.]|nr:pilus assembly protein [Methyloceanibacter sp.]
MRRSKILGAGYRHPNSHCGRRFVREQRGASAVEFALVVPVLIALYLSAIEVNNALTVYRRTLHVATTAADLTAQVKTITQADIQDIQAASTSILTPFATNPLRIVLSSVVANKDNVGKVEWSCANKGAARGKGTTYSVPTGLTEPNSSVIVAEVTYAFEPLVGLSTFFSPGSFTMGQTFYARPRRSLTVKKTDNGC